MEGEAMTEYTDNWITTYSGSKLHYLDPKPEEIKIVDIAHALSFTCRFGGHCLNFYSVAEHSIRVAHILPEELRLSGLLHDSAEAYMPDIPRPIKAYFGLREFENKLLDTILSKYSLQPLNQLVEEADAVLLATEARDLMANMEGWAKLPPPLPMRIIPMTSYHVERLFVERFKLYGGKE